ncbi:hypothetical protein BT69DRAFT_1293988 [Atractiella rhizophila]|nr:hypothetical protein BT69DRAFT_1293988 [Atractiella rhizophila]
MLHRTSVGTCLNRTSEKKLMLISCKWIVFHTVNMEPFLTKGIRNTRKIFHFLRPHDPSDIIQILTALEQPAAVINSSPSSTNSSNDCRHSLRSAPDFSTTESSGWEIAKGMRSEAEGGREEQEERQGGRQAVVKGGIRKFKRFEPNLKVLVPSGS